MLVAWFLGSTLPLCAQPYPLTLSAMAGHDPFVLADASTQTYFLYTSNVPSFTGERPHGTMGYTSKDLRHWSKPVVVFRPPSNFWAQYGAWAPEVHASHGRFYLYNA